MTPSEARSADFGGPDSRGEPGPTPPEAPLAAPEQSLRDAPAARFGETPRFVRAARVTSFGGAAVLTAIGAYQMWRVFDPESVGLPQAALILLFVATFGWIAFSACSAFAGLLFANPAPRPKPAALTSRTAIVMPVYNEDAAASFGALAAMALGARRLAPDADFEVFILSDTRDADAWVRETTAFAALRERLGGAAPVWYRRRERNVGRKAGNVLDFVTRWGGRYDFMLVLDADSVMAPETVVEMARRMQADPGLCLLQSVPQLAGGATPFARLQQFAGAVYGPVVARGVSAWQGEDGNYWGHNAMIRVRAFAESASLPVLEGRKPFGGHILSHDFVEAALMRRAGWAVRMDVDLGGSWEGAPPSLLASAVRDRRWAQGNMQHLAVIGAAGLRWPNRAHFAIGVLSYLMSPIWLTMLAVGLALTAQATMSEPEYFPSAFQLFPDWPQFDAERMKRLFVGSIALLLLPKALGLVEALADGRRRRALGGGVRVVAGAAAEIVASSLAAPVSMLMQSRHVAEIFAGRDSGWATQERDGKALPLGAALAAHGLHCAVGFALLTAVLSAQPELVIWLSPIIAGLIVSPALSRFSGDPRIGRVFARVGLMDTPESREPPAVFGEVGRETAGLRARAAGGLAELPRDAALLRAHVLALPQRRLPADQAERIDAATARAKLGVAEAGSPEAFLALLTPQERAALAGEPALLDAFADAFRNARADGPDAREAA